MRRSVGKLQSKKKLRGAWSRRPWFGSGAQKPQGAAKRGRDQTLLGFSEELGQ